MAYKFEDTLETLRQLREDVKKMETRGADGHDVLIAKIDVLDAITEWIEFLLEDRGAASVKSG